MAMYLLCILRKDESAPTFVKAFYIDSHFIIFHAYMYRVFCHKFCLLLLINGLLTCLRGPQGRLVPPIGSPSVNKVYLLTYLLTLRQGQIWLFWLFYGKKVKTVDFSETIAACDLKVGRCRQLIEIMKVCEY